MKICGVYKIENKENDRVIIGSSKDIKKRWSNYKSLLKKGTYGNKELQDDWNSYGSDKFEFTILDNCLQRDLYVQESFWQEIYAVSLHGYNKNKVTKLKKNIIVGTKARKVHNDRSLLFAGVKNPSASITEEDVLRIRALLNFGYNAKEIYALTDISEAIVYTIKNKSRWKNVEVSTFYDSKDVDYILSAYYCA